jgi:hypothetical protein
LLDLLPAGEGLFDGEHRHSLGVGGGFRTQGGMKEARDIARGRDGP